MARAMADPAAQNLFFSSLGGVRVFCYFQVVSGVAFGWYLDVFFGYLEVSFVDDFENVLVFLRSVNSILIPDLLLPCYRYGRWH